MRYRRRRKRLYMNYYHRPLPRPQRVLLFMIICILVLTAAFSFTLIQLRPIVAKLALAKASNTVLDTINAVVDAEIGKGTFDYSKLITMDKDTSGSIAALETNMALVNLLQTRLSREILAGVKAQMVTEMRIPIGNAIGGIIFSGRGPAFIVKILSVQNVRTSFVNDFSDAGINQTRHKIMLEVSVDIEVFSPGIKQEPLTVKTDVEVCETVIIGKVPNVNVDIGDSKS
jgi:sporulation protein YunB